MRAKIIRDNLNEDFSVWVGDDVKAEFKTFSEAFDYCEEHGIEIIGCDGIWS